MMDTKETVIKKWKENYPVHSIEMGGIGPSYEQAIQILAWEIYSTWTGADSIIGGNYTDEYTRFSDEVTNRLNKFYGFSMAQVGAARNLAAHFIQNGHAETLEKFDDDRKILVTRNFPTFKSEQQDDRI